VCLLLFNWFSVAIHRHWVLMMRRGWDGNCLKLLTCSLCASRRKIDPDVDGKERNRPARSRFAIRRTGSRKVVPRAPSSPSSPSTAQSAVVVSKESTDKDVNTRASRCLITVATCCPRFTKFCGKVWQGARHDHTLVRLAAAHESAVGLMLSRLQALHLVSTSLAASLSAVCVIMAIRHGWQMPTSYNEMLTARTASEFNNGPEDPASVELSTPTWVGFLGSGAALGITILAANSFRFVNLGKTKDYKKRYGETKEQ